jgi:hypothetical protein
MTCAVILPLAIVVIDNRCVDRRRDVRGAAGRSSANAGPAGDRLKEGPPRSAFFRQGATAARPRRVRMRWRPSEEPLGGAKMTTDQIAEARRVAREWKPN